MSKGGGGGTFLYRIGMHLVLCHGPVDKVMRVRVGDQGASDIDIFDGDKLNIQKPYLFGGFEKEGGVIGSVSFRFGSKLQAEDPYLQSQQGSAIPAYRGVVSAILERPIVSANNPYIKPWSFEVVRTTKKADGSGDDVWQPALAAIGFGQKNSMNPAHIVIECLTDTAWGMGYTITTEIDEPSFLAAAQALDAENFGLDIIWDNQQSIEDFIAEILRHINGVLYTDPQSGRYVLKLIRDDYDPATLIVFNESNIQSLERLTFRGFGENANEINVVYRDRTDDIDKTVTVQDMAAVDIQGAVVSETLRYPGIGWAELAALVAQRELQQAVAPLAIAKLVCNREASQLRPGDVFKLDWADYGISGMVMRVFGVDYGTLTDGKIRIDATQDIFAFNDLIYTVPPDSGWSDPISDPLPVPTPVPNPPPAPGEPPPQDPPPPDPLNPDQMRIIEAPFWSIWREVAQESQTAYNEMDPDGGLLTDMAARPSNDALSFNLLTSQAGAAYTLVANGRFSPSGVLAADIDQQATVITLNSDTDLDMIQTGTFGYLGYECVGVTAVDTVLKQLTIDRGVLDTVPVDHLAGETFWLAETFQAIDQAEEYLSPEVVDTKTLTVTGRGSVLQADQPPVSYTMANRHIRPYPPGKIRINGVAWPAAPWASPLGDITVAWAHRDRTLQTAYLVDQEAADIGPEPGTTYTIRFYTIGEPPTPVGYGDAAYGEYVYGDIVGSGITPDLNGRLDKSPASLAFGLVTTGGTKNLGVLLTNLGSPGDQDIILSPIAISGADAAEYSHDAVPPITLAPGASTTITVTFSPTTDGSKAASLDITHDGTNSPVNIALSGTGYTPSASGAPAVYGDASYGEKVYGE